MSKRKTIDDLEPQKASAAQILTYIASTGATSEKFALLNLLSEECL